MRSINRIGRKDTIKAYSYDKNRKLITSLYDSGFHSIEEIVNRLNEKGSGWLKAIYEVNIINEDKNISCWYVIKGNKIINIPSAEAARGEDGLAQLYVLPPQSTLTIHVGKRKIKLRPEELQKVTGERGRRGTLMRGLQRIDRVEIDSPRRASSGDSEE